MRLGVVAYLFALIAPFTCFSVHHQRKHAPRAVSMVEVQVADARHNVPLIYWTAGIETAEVLKRAGIEQIAAPPDKAETLVTVEHSQADNQANEVE